MAFGALWEGRDILSRLKISGKSPEIPHRRVWGHAAIFAWSDLILDRGRKLVGLQSPAAFATRAGGDSDPNFENCATSSTLSPRDTGRGVHA